MQPRVHYTAQEGKQAEWKAFFFFLGGGPWAELAAVRSPEIQWYQERKHGGWDRLNDQVQTLAVPLVSHGIDLH